MMSAKPNEDALFQAALTASQNLVTSMNLHEHPSGCFCYGCGLCRAVIREAFERGRLNVAEIVKRELAAERITSEMLNFRFGG
jgi:cytidine deaminase